jgi:DNA processing protein
MLTSCDFSKFVSLSQYFSMNLSNVNSLKPNDNCYPDSLNFISKPPKQLFWMGNEPSNWLDLPKVAIVGSRKITPYGKDVTNRLATALAQAGVAILSGLAFGVDAMAHEATVKASGMAIAVLPTSLDNIQPVSNRQLASKILETKGTLITEYPNGSFVSKVNFIERNRIVSGLCDVLLITEAAVNSGSLHTARFALEQGKTVMAVPGNINSPTSEGCNNLIKSGAVPVTTAEDVFFALKINPSKQKQSRAFKGSTAEKQILQLISEGISVQEELALAAKLDGQNIGSVLTMLEINGQIRSLGAGQWAIS